MCLLLSFNLTGKCNLRCSYCAVKGGEKNTSDIKPKLIKETVKKIRKKYNNDYINLHCIGDGEPLLNWDAILTVEQIRKKDDRVYCSINTNGTLTKEIIYLAKRGWIIFVSHDGINNKLYRDKNNIVERTIKELTKIKAKFAIKATLSSDISKKELLKSVKLWKKLGVKYIIIGPIFPIGRAKDYKIKYNKKIFLDAMEYAGKIGLKIIYSIAEPCTLATTGYYIMPDGKLSICYAKFTKPTKENRNLAKKQGCILFPYKKLFN